MQLQGFDRGDQTQLSVGLTAPGKGNPAVMFSRCGNKLGGTWAFTLEEGSTWPECRLVFAPRSEMCADFSDLGFCLTFTGRAHRDASTHLQ